MRKIILNLAVSLDGFIEGPNGEIDWCIMDEAEMGKQSAFDKFLESIDSIFYGRVSYDLWGQYQPAADGSSFEKDIWNKVHIKKKYVFSANPKPDGKARFISSDIPKAVKGIKSEPGKDIWLYGGASLITSFMNLRLVDSYLLAVHPVILGAGKPLFADIKNRVDLKLNQVIHSASGVVLLAYETRK